MLVYVSYQIKPIIGFVGNIFIKTELINQKNNYSKVNNKNILEDKFTYRIAQTKYKKSINN